MQFLKNVQCATRVECRISRLFGKFLLFLESCEQSSGCGRTFMSFSLRMYARHVGSGLASSSCRGVTKISQELPEDGLEKSRNAPEIKMITLQKSLH